MDKLTERKATLEHNLAHVTAERNQVAQKLTQLDQTILLIRGGILTIEEMLKETDEAPAADEAADGD